MNRIHQASFEPFALERYQSLYERTVEINLADSGIQCLTTREWLTHDEQETLLDTGLYYPQVNGSTELRRRIAALYPGAVADNVLVTVGASQANHILCAALLEPGDEVVVMSPGYRQVWGLARNAGCIVKELVLRPEENWRPNLDELDALVGPRTRLISIVNPHNPTGLVLNKVERARIVQACGRVGAWLHADEVYAGTEHGDAEEVESFWGAYDRVVCANSLSKAYGLAGLRIGWAVASQKMIDALWRRHEYTVIAAAAPSMALAAMALTPSKRRWLLQRQKDILVSGRRVLQEWLARHGDRFSMRPSAATSIAFVRYNYPVPSYELAEHIRKATSVLVAPGSLLGAEDHLRIAIGYEPEKVECALERIKTSVATI